jgi:PadR family transcriptional regulator PadR
MKASDPVVDEWEKKWRKSVLPMAILAVLSEGPKHGYALAVDLRAVIGAAAPEGTLYPLLNGFERDGLTKADWAIQESGPARKIYALTPKGAAVLKSGAESWLRFRRDIGGLIDA